jgi:adenylate cyclase
LEQSLSVEPNYARAYSMLSTTYVIAWLNRLDGDYLNPAVLDRAHELARRAVQLDPSVPHTHASLGAAMAWKGQHPAAIAQFDKALGLNPNFTDWRFAIALVCGGQPARAVEILETHMRLDPFYAPLALHWLGFARYMLKQYSEALTPLRECILRAPTFRSAHAWLAAAHVQLGQLEAARREVSELLKIDPHFTIAGSLRPILTFERPQDAAHCFDTLREAGLPER